MLLYYLIYRLHTRPEITKEQVKDEYWSAFGSAAPKIAEHIEYWENYSKEHKARDGRLVEFNEKDYSFEDIRRGEAILDQALGRLRDNEQDARNRILWLKEGLKHVRLYRDVCLEEDTQARLTKAYRLDRFRQAHVHDHLLQREQLILRELSK